jgi:hypothetical protein
VGAVVAVFLAGVARVCRATGAVSALKVLALFYGLVLAMALDDSGALATVVLAVGILVVMEKLARKKP